MKIGSKNTFFIDPGISEIRDHIGTHLPSSDDLRESQERYYVVKVN